MAAVVQRAPTPRALPMPRGCHCCCKRCSPHFQSRFRRWNLWNFVWLLLSSLFSRHLFENNNLTEKYLENCSCSLINKIHIIKTQDTLFNFFLSASFHYLLKPKPNENGLECNATAAAAAVPPTPPSIGLIVDALVCCCCCCCCFGSCDAGVTSSNPGGG